ncbi:hypothetical protein, partial [Chryseobacterium sp.]|uniref:hypothetical protein n=1 Tax=Chryseobacterium sp. TaxID=1871047 RepID=UPI0035C67D2E
LSTTSVIVKRSKQSIRNYKKKNSSKTNAKTLFITDEICITLLPQNNHHHKKTLRLKTPSFPPHLSS